MRPEFVGAYCGGKPSNLPDEHDIANALPEEAYMAALKEDIDAYNRFRVEMLRHLKTGDAHEVRRGDADSIP